MNRRSRQQSLLVLSAPGGSPPGAGAPMLVAGAILPRVRNNTVSGRRGPLCGQERIGNAGGRSVRVSERSYWGKRSGLPGVTLRGCRSSHLDLGSAFENPSSVGNEVDGIDWHWGAGWLGRLCNGGHKRIVGGSLRTTWRIFAMASVRSRTKQRPFVRRGIGGSFPLCFRKHTQANRTECHAWNSSSRPAEREQ